MESFLIKLIQLIVLLAIGLVESQSPDHWNKVAEDDLKAALNMVPNTNKAKNVILFIGDGMDIETITAARIYKGQLEGNTGEENFLNFEKFPHTASSKTYNTDRQTPDSAATAVAIVSGVKTNYRLLGFHDAVKKKDCVSATRDRQIESILDWSYEEGKSTGIVTTARITHATPAAVFAHSPYRYWEGQQDITRDSPYDPEGNCKDVAHQLIHNNSFINVLFGGGRRYFLKTDDLDPESHTPDLENGRLDTNLIEVWKKKKEQENKRHKYVWNKQQFDEINASETDYVLGLFERSHMQYEYERNGGPDGEPSIAEMTKKAIQILEKNDNGYFLMVEGARIDHSHHRNIAKAALEETLSFEKAVGEAIALTDEKDTLIVVTADHGHVLNMAGYQTRGNNILGLINVEKSIPADNISYTTLSYGNGPGYDAGKRVNDTNDITGANGYVQVSAVPLVKETHGGQDVNIYARGPMSHLFHRVHEQNYIAHVMAYASCVGANKDHCKYPPRDDCDVNISTRALPHVVVELVSLVIITIFNKL